MYVITGATGNTGHIVAEKLLAEGKQVRVLGRDIDRLSKLAEAGAEAFALDINDPALLAEAFSGATAAYVMLPPSMTSDDYRADQDRTSRALAAAIEKSNITHVVSLSSVGADKESKTGPVVGLHNMELALNKLPKLNVLHLRAAYFMENTIVQVGTIKAMSISAGPLRGDLKISMIAARDIGAVAADELSRLDFEHHQTRELLGQRDLSMNEVARILGKAVGIPDLKYIHLEDNQVKPAMMRMGLSENVASLILEMAGALNSGHMTSLEPRSEANTTPTSFETFAAEVFVPLFKGKSTGA